MLAPPFSVSLHSIARNVSVRLFDPTLRPTPYSSSPTRIVMLVLALATTVFYAQKEAL